MSWINFSHTVLPLNCEGTILDDDTVKAAALATEFSLTSRTTIYPSNFMNTKVALKNALSFPIDTSDDSAVKKQFTLVERNHAVHNRKQLYYV